MSGVFELISTVPPSRSAPFLSIRFLSKEAEMKQHFVQPFVAKNGARGEVGIVRSLFDEVAKVFGDCGGCFTEPQFTPALAKTLTQGTNARLGSLDPLGAGLKPGPGLYAAMMRGMASSMLACLGANG